MYRPEVEGEIQARYHAKKRKKGLKDCHIWLTAQQWEVVRPFAQCVRKIKNIEHVRGLDVSPDYLSYKIIIEEKPPEIVIGEYEGVEIV